MAQTTAPATSIRDKDSCESRMVVTFLMSALESMVSREIKQLHHYSLGMCSIAPPHCLLWGAGKV